MTTNIATGSSSPLGVLILAWLLTKPDGGTRSELGRALKFFLDSQWSPAEQRQAIDEAVESLEREGQTARVRKTALKLTEGGRRAGLSAFGLETLPGWRTLKRYLLTPALGIPLPTTKATRNAYKPERVCAAVVARGHQLGLGASPTKRQVIDAIVRQALGLDPRTPLTLNTVCALFLNRALGATKPLEFDMDAAFEQLAARAVGARRANASEIQTAIVGRWLSGSPIVSAAKPRGDAAPAPSLPKGDAAPAPSLPKGDAAPAPSLPKAVEPLDDNAFAARVLETARASKTGRFGDRKVFISHIFRRLVQERAVAEDADAFKERLVSAHRQGLLALSRADLVEAMDPEDVEASEARYLSATFHFVRISRD